MPPTRRTVSTAGAYDLFFGAASTRDVPLDFVVVLTSEYSADTGYSWTELRGIAGAGYSVPDTPLSGDMAYEPSGDTTLTAGVVCKMTLDRDQTVYCLEPIYTTGGGGGSGSGGGGSGSGSGDGCNAAVQPVSYQCVNGRLVATTWTVGVGRDGSQLVVSRCTGSETDLGPCSPNNPSGTTLPVVTKVCPVYADCVTVTAADSPYQITSANAKVVVDASGGAIDLYLPLWTVSDEWFTIVVADDSNTITLYADGTLPDAVNGGASVELTTQWSIWIVEALCVAGAWAASAGSGGSASGVSSFNTRTGAVTLTSLDVTTALGYTPGTGDALTTNPLSQFAATTSAQLRGVLSDETGTGFAYFQGGDLGTPSAGVLTNCTGTAAGLTAGVASTVSTANEAADTTCFPLFSTSSGTASVQPKNSLNLTYNSSTGALLAVSLASGGTGGAGHYVKQTSAGGAFTSGTIAATDYAVFVGAGGSAARGAVPAPGATAHTNVPYYLGDDAAFHLPRGYVLGRSDVDTAQTTTSGTNVDLTTVQSVSITLDATTDVTITAFAVTSNTTGTAIDSIATDVDGTDYDLSQVTCTTATGPYPLAGCKTVSLASGAHTIKLQFRTNAGTATFQTRRLEVKVG